MSRPPARRVLAAALAAGAALASCGGGGPPAVVPPFLAAVAPAGSSVLFVRTNPRGVLVAAELLDVRCTQTLAIGVRRGTAQTTYTDSWYAVRGVGPADIVSWQGLEDVIVVRVAPSVTSVTWRIDGLAVDRMAPADGWVVLVGPRLSQSTPFLTVTEGTVVAYRHGSTVASVAVDDADVHPPAMPTAADQAPTACP